MKQRSWIFLSILLTLILFSPGGLPSLLPIPPIPKDYGAAVHFRDGTLMRVYATRHGMRRYYLPLSGIDPLLVKATIAYEDHRFYYHPGVDPLAMARAAWQDLRAGHVISGGSTLTLQLARLLRPGPRTFWRKFRETLWALGLEARLSKRRILELYLNLAPYGGNLEGIGAASLAYFGRLPGSLTPDEIAFLVSLPQAPIRGKREDRAARNRVLSRMRVAGLISRDAFLKARRAPLPRHLHPFPFRAPHAGDFLHLKYPGRLHLTSTLSPEIQALTETVLRRYRERILTLGATEAAGVVIDNRDRSIRALVGSLNYWDSLFQGQVRGFAARRSTGSTLKPFLYALALQRGVITPLTRLEDRPRAYGAFRPVDFTPRFRGMVPAKMALAISLNLPFVNLLREVGIRPFLSMLKHAGFHWGKAPGLSAVTGGMETTLLDLTNLYATLARGGRHGPPRLLVTDPLRETPLFHPGAAYLTLQALRCVSHGMPRPGFDVAWKTGTSFGQRDAWAIGISPRYTVGVWVGNFSGQGALGLTGAQAALPAALDIIRALGSDVSRFPVPDHRLVWIRICPDSGLPVGPYCPKSLWVPFPKGAPLPRRCFWHRPFIMERGTPYRACPWKTYPSGQLEQRIFLVVPGHPLPPFAPSCSAKETAEAVRILSPTAGSLYLLSRKENYSRGLPLKAMTEQPNGVLYWFINGKLVAKSHSGSVVYVTPPAGQAEILAVDALGHWGKVTSWIDYTSPPCPSFDHRKVGKHLKKFSTRSSLSEGRYGRRRWPQRSGAPRESRG